MNDLIERYLAAVARELPEAERADITAELRDELLTQVEIRESALGRPIATHELEAELIAFGHPLVVAGRYRRVQHLIGPELYPFWRTAVRSTLMVILVIYLVLFVIGSIARGEVQGLDLPEPLLLAGLAFGAVTGVFALMERYGDPAKVARWRPTRLAPVKGVLPSRFDLLTEVGIGAVFILWWVGVVRFSNLFPGTAVGVELGPVWDRYFWWVLGYAAIDVGSNVVALARPDQVQLVRWMVVWRSLLGAGVLLAVIQAGDFLRVTGSTSVAADVLELWVKIALYGAVIAFLARVATEAWRLRRDDSAVSAGA